MNICYLLGGFTANGGIGRVTSILTNEQCKNEKYNIFTLSFYKTNKPNLYNLDDRIHQDFLLESPANMTKCLLKGGAFKLRKYLKQNNIDILIACGALYYPISVLAVAFTNVKLIGWEHSNVQNDKDHSFQKLTRRAGAKHADLLVPLTKFDENDYKNHYKIENVKQVYNPVDRQAFKYVKDYNSDSKKILSVGRLSYQKYFEKLIDVADVVIKKHPDWSWDICGEGSDRESLQQKIDACGLTDRLILKGQLSNLYEIYNDYSFIVMTSRYEGFPMSLLEASANGLPMVSFDVLTGPNEIIDEGQNGFLIEPFDENKMSEKIEYLIENPDVRISMSDEARKKCNEFTLDKIIARWDEIFKSI